MGTNSEVFKKTVKTITPHPIHHHHRRWYWYKQIGTVLKILFVLENTYKHHHHHHHHGPPPKQQFLFIYLFDFCRGGGSLLNYLYKDNTISITITVSEEHHAKPNPTQQQQANSYNTIQYHTGTFHLTYIIPVTE